MNATSCTSDVSLKAGRPSTRTDASASMWRPPTQLSSVVLPEPLAPTRRQRAPAGTARSSARNTGGPPA